MIPGNNFSQAAVKAYSQLTEQTRAARSRGWGLSTLNGAGRAGWRLRIPVVAFCAEPAR